MIPVGAVVTSDRGTGTYFDGYFVTVGKSDTMQIAHVTVVFVTRILTADHAERRIVSQRRRQIRGAVMAQRRLTRRVVG